MTADDFRQAALELAGAEEKRHMAHPDFRVNGKIFATLGYPDEAWGALMLTPEHQRGLLEAYRGVFVPANGAWGARGSTMVKLRDAEPDVVREALHAAWEAPASKPKAKRR